MTPERWARIRGAFEKALDTPEHDRRRLLEAECGSDIELRGEVERLLAAGADATLRSPVADLFPSSPTFAPGDSVGHYIVESELGAGGMGVVYCASDTRLSRRVALKFINAEFSNWAQREARSVAALNHTNICTLYDVGSNYLVMELVEGPTLADRIQQGPIPLDEALAIGRQIVSGMVAAHDRGIVHCDLKPANIKVKPDGTVKVLDFGLASFSVAPGSSHESGATANEVGVVMGTAAYMAPEQARGEPVNKRVDIWAFGCVLYQMLTGAPAFNGQNTGEVLAAVMTKEPDLTRVHFTVRRLLRRCLEKDSRKRLRDIGDVWDLLEDGSAPAAAVGGLLWAKRASVAWAATALCAIISGVACWFAWHSAAPVDHQLTRLGIDLGPDAVLDASSILAISRDGRRIVFPARGPNGQHQLAFRELNEAEPTLLAGTEGAFNPFFSPDGQWIGFFAAGQLKKVSIQGGAPVSLTSLVLGRAAGQGASWGDDGNIVTTMGTLSPLALVFSGGGPAQPLTRLASGESAHSWPQVLPHANAVLFTAVASLSGMENANIEAVSLKTREIKIVQHGGYFGRYLPTGHLVYMHHGKLFGVKFDPDRLEIRGTPAPLLGDVAANPSTGGGQFDFSATGTLVYAASNNAAQSWGIGWVSSSGPVRPLLANPGAYTHPRLSPDGRKLSFNGSNQDIYVYDLDRETTSRLTFTGHANSAVWTPDGKHIVFASTSDHSLYWLRSDSAAAPQRLLEASSNLAPWSFSPDGRHLAFFERIPRKGDLFTLPLDLTDADHPRPGRPEPFLQTPADELLPNFSHDGRWIAYLSDESGTGEVYVRPFPDAKAGKWQVSNGGGSYTFWSKNGSQLFYESSDKRIMVVDYKVKDDVFVPSKPRVWREQPLFDSGLLNLDLAPDGTRFAVLYSPEPPAGRKDSAHAIILLNFFEEVRRRIP